MQDIVSLFNTFTFLDLSNPVFGITAIIIVSAVVLGGLILGANFLEKIDSKVEWRISQKLKNKWIVKIATFSNPIILSLVLMAICFGLWVKGLDLSIKVYENLDSTIAKGKVNLETFENFKSKLTPEQIVKLNSAIFLTYDGKDKAERFKVYQNADKSQLFWTANEVKLFFKDKSDNFIAFEKLNQN